VPAKHAERHHPRWWAEVTADGTEPSDP
jgi:hypothetical protein